MRLFSVRLFIAMLVIAVGCNGTLLRVAFAAPAQAAHHHLAQADGKQAHPHSSHAGHHGTKDQAPVKPHDHADTGAKCCSMCLVVAHAMPTCSASPVTFSYATIHFPLARQTLAGHLVPLDPDIPKSLL